MHLKKINDDIEKHEHVNFIFDDGTCLRYRDTRKFGKMYLYAKEEVNNFIDNVNLNVTNNPNEITSIKENITNLQTDISNYALNSDLDSLSSAAFGVQSITLEKTLHTKLLFVMGMPSVNNTFMVFVDTDGSGTLTTNNNGTVSTETAIGWTRPIAIYGI